MNNRKFTLWNRITAVAVAAVAALTYLLTIEPTASFWDCGEFIASSYKLEVGHPPGNPVFQLFARLFTMFTDNMHAAVAVNVFSAICSALTIFFLYLTIVFLAKRLVKPSEDGTYSLGKAIAIFASGAVGALAYTFSDTFWFSAVEGEVYAMSSLITALVFWAMTKWYEQADQPYANRWIVLISLLMGLSIGIHLLNLLAIPALVFMYYYKQRESGHYTMWEYVKIFLVSVVILAVILFGIIPYLPKLAAYFDLFFVNTLGLPFNSGAAFFMVVLLGGCFYGLFRTMKQEKVLANTVLLCFTMIVIGFSLFTIVIIRSSAKTPTNEYQPDNPFTLVRYLGREQYGSNPLVYGQYFGAPYEIEETRYWAPMGDRYINAEGPGDVVYGPEGKMLFPRMWSGNDPRHIQFYKSYMGKGGQIVPGAEHKKPTFFQNMIFFFDYQLNWMYWRYFMWNFAGRQNDIHSPSPGDPFVGNWESGIKLLDDFRLGDQSMAPGYLKDNPGKNHYYMLPLLLGLVGLFFQFGRDKRGCWLTFLMFFMTGIAIVVYLNQPPFQVRERDYAYAGSFYSFSMWIGLAVAAVYSWIEERVKGKEALAASAVAVLLLGVPALMAAENWDDHDRSNRYTAVEMAKNYLNSVGPNGVLITHGDNDTFPLWYAQEVENVRTDVRIANTSLLGTDWHIDQMKYAMNESAPLDLTVEPQQYLYGTNEFIYIYDTRDSSVLLSDVMRIFKHPNAKLPLSSGKMVDYIMSRKFIIPVNKENVLKYGILDEKYADQIPDQITLTIPKDKDYLTKPELFMLDLLSNYQWDRPINLLSMGGDINIGLKDYLMYEGFSYKFVPIRNRMKSTEIGFADPEDLYDKMKNVFSWDALKRTDYFVDYQNFYTFCGVLSQRQLFVNVAKEMLKVGDDARAVEILDVCQENVPAVNYPLDMTYLGFSNEYMVIDMIETYYAAGADDKALDLAKRFIDEIFVSTEFFLYYYDLAKREFESCYSCISYVADVIDHYGNKEYANEIRNRFNSLLDLE
jgi:MFS family permease